MTHGYRFPLTDTWEGDLYKLKKKEGKKGGFFQHTPPPLLNNNSGHLTTKI